MSSSFISQSLQEVTQNLLRADPEKPQPQPRSGVIKCASGPARTHAHLTEAVITQVGPRVTHRDTFYCKGAVNVGRLLHLARKELYNLASNSGANVLLNEEWRTEISSSRFRSKDRYKVLIVYSANIARSLRSDAQKPIALESAKGVDGVMIVLNRRE